MLIQLSHPAQTGFSQSHVVSSKLCVHMRKLKWTSGFCRSRCKLRNDPHFRFKEIAVTCMTCVYMVAWLHSCLWLLSAVATGICSDLARSGKISPALLPPCAAQLGRFLRYGDSLLHLGTNPALFWIFCGLLAVIIEVPRQLVWEVMPMVSPFETDLTGWSIPGYMQATKSHG